jgi:hypothetical protein
METTEQKKNLDELLPLIRQSHETTTTCDKLCKEQGWKSIQSAITTGQYLTEAKSLVVHGEWTNWLKTNFVFSPKTAENYMRLADPKHVSVLNGCPTLRQAYIRCGICQPNKVDEEPTPEKEPGETKTTTVTTKEPTPFDKAVKLERSLRRLFTEENINGEMIKLLKPLVEIYNEYYEKLETETEDLIEVVTVEPVNPPDRMREQKIQKLLRDINPFPNQEICVNE